MSALVKLNLKTVKRIVETDPVTARRQKLATAIDEQLAALAAEREGKVYEATVQRRVRTEDGTSKMQAVARKVRAWYFAQDGGYYVQCRYGTRLLMLHGKSNAVFVDKLEQVADVLRVFREAAVAGELDRAMLVAMSGRNARTQQQS